MRLPLKFDINPKGKVVELHDGDGGYAENIEYSLEMTIQGDDIEFDYYGETGNRISEMDPAIFKAVLKMRNR